LEEAPFQQTCSVTAHLKLLFAIDSKYSVKTIKYDAVFCYGTKRSQLEHSNVISCHI